MLEVDEELIRACVAAQPDITLAELTAKVIVQNNRAAVSLMTMSNELQRLGLPRKKR